MLTCFLFIMLNIFLHVKFLVFYLRKLKCKVIFVKFKIKLDLELDSS